MKPCPECGEEVADDAAHCGHCGAQIEEAGRDKETMFGVGAISDEELEQAAEQSDDGDDTDADETGGGGGLSIPEPSDDGGSADDETDSGDGGGGVSIPQPGDVGDDGGAGEDGGGGGKGDDPGDGTKIGMSGEELQRRTSDPGDPGALDEGDDAGSADDGQDPALAPTESLPSMEEGQEETDAGAGETDDAGASEGAEPADQGDSGVAPTKEGEPSIDSELGAGSTGESRPDLSGSATVDTGTDPESGPTDISGTASTTDSGDVPEAGSDDTPGPASDDPQAASGLGGDDRFGGDSASTGGGPEVGDAPLDDPDTGEEPSVGIDSSPPEESTGGPMEMGDAGEVTSESARAEPDAGATQPPETTDESDGVSDTVIYIVLGVLGASFLLCALTGLVLYFFL